MAQPHQGDPAQAAGLDQLVAAGTHRVPVDAPSFDLGTTTPFQGLIDAENQRAVAAVQVLEQQRQQDASRLTGRPYRPVEHLMVAGVVEVVAAAHDAQRCGHGALARGQYRPEQQHLGFPPSRVGKQRYEGNEYGYNGIGQGEHGWTFSEIWVRPAYPVLLLSLNFAQSPAFVFRYRLRTVSVLAWLGFRSPCTCPFPWRSAVASVGIAVCIPIAPGSVFLRARIPCGPSASLQPWVRRPFGLRNAGVAFRLRFGGCI